MHRFKTKIQQNLRGDIPSHSTGLSISLQQEQKNTTYSKFVITFSTNLSSNSSGNTSNFLLCNCAGLVGILTYDILKTTNQISIMIGRVRLINCQEGKVYSNSFDLQKKGFLKFLGYLSVYCITPYYSILCRCASVLEFNT